MNKTVRTLVRKELVEALRDRRVLFMAVILPVLIYPAIMGASNHFERKQRQQTRSKVLNVAVTGPEDRLRALVQEDSLLTLVATSPADSLRARIQSGALHLWVDAPSGMAAPGTAGLPTIRLLHDATSKESREALRRVRERLTHLKETERQARYEAAGGAGDLVDVLALESADVATESEAAAAGGGRMLVYLLLMVLFMGGSAFAIDQVAGEKERGTLETLFLIPAGRQDIAHSKLIYVAIGTAITGSLTMLGLFITYRLGWMDSGAAMEGVKLSVKASLMAVTLVIPLAILVGSILLIISTLARTLKDAQTYQVPMLLVMFIPALMATSQSIELNPLLAAVPIANVAFAIRDVLLGQMNAGLHVMVVGSTLVWAALALRWVGTLMSREEMVLGFDPEPFLARTRAGRSRALHVAMAMSVLAFFYVGNFIQARWELRGVALTFWVLLPLLALLTARLAWSGGEVRDVLSLRAPTPRGLLGALCLGAGAMLPIAGGLAELQSRFLPVPQMQFEALEAVFVGAPTWQLGLLLAVSPAIWEEVLFRGVCLGLFSRVTSSRSAIVLSSVYFGIIHLSVFRLFPTFVLGLAMAAIVVRSRSLLNSMVFHGVYNGGLVLGARYVERGGELPIDPQGALAWAASLVSLAAGAWLIRSSAADD